MRFTALYAQAFNEKLGRVGHLFQSRFGSRWVHDEIQLAVVLGYIAVNPVVAGLCDTPADWRWASHRRTLEGTPSRLLDLDRLRDHLAPLGDLARVYRMLVNARLVSDALLLPA